MTDVERDAGRYRWLRSKLKFSLAQYNGPDYLSNATRSLWLVESEALLVGTDKPPISVDSAIDKAMEVENGNA